VQGYRAMSYQPAPQYFAPVYQGNRAMATCRISSCCRRPTRGSIVNSTAQQ
jgi:hypothetical protein